MPARAALGDELRAVWEECAHPLEAEVHAQDVEAAHTALADELRATQDLEECAHPPGRSCLRRTTTTLATGGHSDSHAARRRRGGRGSGGRVPRRRSPLLVLGLAAESGVAHRLG